MPPSVAREVFDRLVKATDPVAAIRGLAHSDPPTFEDDWLDCKQEPDDIKDPGQRDKKLKQMWLQALSGFANNEGGVLLWGLVARKDQNTNVDKVVGEKPVSDPFGLKSKLNEWRRQGTDPPLGNVQIEPFEFPAGSGRGFVVCHIPEGPHKPYRTNDGEKSQFYLRSSDNFVVMSPAILRAMFYPRTKAIFRLEADLSWRFPDEGQGYQPMLTELTLEVRLSNVGIATAKDILLRAEPDIPPQSVGAIQSDAGVEMGPGWQRETGYLRKLSPMHPGMPQARVFLWSWEEQAVTAYSERGNRVVPHCSNPCFTFVVYTENQEPQHFKVEFDMDELIIARHKTVEASPVAIDEVVITP